MVLHRSKFWRVWTLHATNCKWLLIAKLKKQTLVTWLLKSFCSILLRNKIKIIVIIIKENQIKDLFLYHISNSFCMLLQLDILAQNSFLGQLCPMHLHHLCPCTLTWVPLRSQSPLEVIIECSCGPTPHNMALPMGFFHLRWFFNWIKYIWIYE